MRFARMFSQMRKTLEQFHHRPERTDPRPSFDVDRDPGFDGLVLFPRSKEHSPGLARTRGDFGAVRVSSERYLSNHDIARSEGMDSENEKGQEAVECLRDCGIR